MVTKKKKLQDKLRLYYRGPNLKPSKKALDSDLNIILKALEEYNQSRNTAYQTIWNREEVTLQIAIGLDKTLRNLKRKSARALIYDETSSDYLRNFFKLSGIPTIEAQLLKNIAPKLKFKTILVFSLIEPDQQVKNTIKSEAFDELCSLFSEQKIEIPQNKQIFKLPQIERVPSSGNSKAKKEAKKELKKKPSPSKA